MHAGLIKRNKPACIQNTKSFKQLDNMCGFFITCHKKIPSHINFAIKTFFLAYLPVTGGQKVAGLYAFVEKKLSRFSN